VLEDLQWLAGLLLHDLNIPMLAVRACHSTLAEVSRSPTGDANASRIDVGL
jgi:hypothetical protein